MWTDVDMTYPNDLIPELVQELEGYDQVVGARTSEQGTHKLLPGAGQVVHPQAGGVPAADRRSPTSTPACGPSAATWPCSTSASCPPGSRCVTTITMTFLANGYSVKYWPIEYSDAGRDVEVPLVRRTPAATCSRSSA